MKVFGVVLGMALTVLTVGWSQLSVAQGFGPREALVIAEQFNLNVNQTGLRPLVRHRRDGLSRFIRPSVIVSKR